MSNAFSAIKYARSLRERVPEARPRDVLVFICFASHGDGKTGTNIFPSYERIMDETGFSLAAVRRAVKKLEEWGELRCVKTGWNGSAAAFIIPALVSKQLSSEPLQVAKELRSAPEAAHQRATTSGTREAGAIARSDDGVGTAPIKHCRRHPDVEIFRDECVKCEEDKYWATRS